MLILVAVALGAIGYAEGGALAARAGRLARDLLGGGAVRCRSRSRSARVAAATSDLQRRRRRLALFAYVAAISALFGFFPWYAGLARGGVAKIGQIQLVQPLLTLAWSAGCSTSTSARRRWSHLSR